jgi:hypothetical protein
MDGHGIICHMPVTCDVCSREFTPARADARYCSGKCRTQAYRRRAEPDRKPARRAPLPDAIRNRTYDLGKVADSLERLSWDDRLPRALKTDSVQIEGRRIGAAADRLLEVAVRINPVTSDHLATPKRSRRGHRRSPEEVLEATLPALGGMEIVFNEITALNLTPEDAHRATVGLDKAIRALTRIKSLI